MAPFLAHQQEEQTKYDLYGVVNHFGGINSGHYMCYVKNERGAASQWLQYDDSYVKPVAESRVRSEFAYILFYRRKDLAGLPLDRVYRTVEAGDWFRGSRCACASGRSSSATSGTGGRRRRPSLGASTT